MLQDEDRVKKIIAPMLLAKYGCRGLSPQMALLIARQASAMATKGENTDRIRIPLDPARPADIQYADYIGMKAVSLRNG